jgi:hypothetical protein
MSGRYVESMRKIINKNDDIEDPISLEEIDLNEESPYRHKTIFLRMSNNIVKPFNTEHLYNYVNNNNNPINPLTRVKLDKNEMDYINHYHNCYKFEFENNLKCDENLENYIKQLKNNYIQFKLDKLSLSNDNDIQLIETKFNIPIIAYIAFLSIEHFITKCECDNDPSDLTFERNKSIDILNQNQNQDFGKNWVLRNSSENRRLNLNENIEFGESVYAITFKNKDNEIIHSLFYHKLGFGWYTYGKDKKIIVRPCFLDLLDLFLNKLDLNFTFDDLIFD